MRESRKLIVHKAKVSYAKSSLICRLYDICLNRVGDRVFNSIDVDDQVRRNTLPTLAK